MARFITVFTLGGSNPLSASGTKAGDKVVQAFSITSPVGDVTADFAPVIPDDNTIVQVAGSSTGTCLILLERPNG